MADKEKKSTMKGFATNDQADYYSGIRSIRVNGNNSYELNGKFLDDLHSNAFSGTNEKDAELGSDKIEPTNDETSDLEETDHDNEQEIGEIFRIETKKTCAFMNHHFKDYEEFRTIWIYEWNKDVPWVHEKPWTNYGAWKEPTLFTHCCKPFNYKTGCSEWPTCSWRNDGYFNRGNLPGAYIIENSLQYQDYEWYEALEDKELKEECWELYIHDLVPLDYPILGSYFKMEMDSISSPQIHKVQIRFCLPSRTLQKRSSPENREREKIGPLCLWLYQQIILLNFITPDDAKEMWEAIKSRFGVSTEDAHQKFLRSLPSSWSQVSLIMRTKPGVDSLSFDDLYNNLRVFENDLDEFDLEEMDLKWQVAMISMRMKKFYKKTGHFAKECRTKGNQDSKRRDAWNSRNKDGRRYGKQDDSKALVTIDGEGVD
ncbi:hypothetical protein Tco_0794203 [Tanacetum coccineum]